MAGRRPDLAGCGRFFSTAMRKSVGGCVPMPTAIAWTVAFRFCSLPIRRLKSFWITKLWILKACYPGSRAWFGDHFNRVADPFRHPIDPVAWQPHRFALRQGPRRDDADGFAFHPFDARRFVDPGCLGQTRVWAVHD